MGKETSLALPIAGLHGRAVAIDQAQSADAHAATLPGRNRSRGAPILTGFTKGNNGNFSNSSLKESTGKRRRITHEDRGGENTCARGSPMQDPGDETESEVELDHDMSQEIEDGASVLLQLQEKQLKQERIMVKDEYALRFAKQHQAQGDVVVVDDDDLFLEEPHARDQELLLQHAEAHALRSMNRPAPPLGNSQHDVCPLDHPALQRLQQQVDPERTTALEHQLHPDQDQANTSPSDDEDDGGQLATHATPSLAVTTDVVKPMGETASAQTSSTGDEVDTALELAADHMEELADAATADEQEEPVPWTSNVDAAAEEELMAIVLRHQTELRSTGSESGMRIAVVRASQGQFVTLCDAQAHFISRATLLDDPDSSEYAKLSPKLREMLRQFRNLKKYGRRTTRTAVSTNDYREQAPLPPIIADETASEIATQPCAERVETCTKSKAPRSSVDAACDELLVQLILEKRLFDAQSCDGRTRVWKAIIVAFNHPRFKSGVDGNARLRWLVNVFENHTHDEHGKLSPKLRELLATYIRVVKEKAGPLDVRPTSRGKHPASDCHQVATSKRTRATRLRRVVPENSAPECIESASRDNVSDDPRRLIPHTVAEPSGSVATAAAAEEVRENEILLREILRIRPSNTCNGGSTALWERVAESVSRQLGSRDLFPTGRSCIRRLKEIRNEAARGSNGIVTGCQVEMLNIIDRLITLQKNGSPWRRWIRPSTDRS